MLCHLLCSIVLLSGATVAYRGNSTDVLWRTLAVAANIAIVGLSLYPNGFDGVGACMQLGLPMILAVTIFSQYMRGLAVPMPGGRRCAKRSCMMMDILLEYCQCSMVLDLLAHGPVCF